MNRPIPAKKTPNLKTPVIVMKPCGLYGISGGKRGTFYKNVDTQSQVRTCRPR